ncbi:MAG: retroviral-like aspartic protease family protein [Gammaproteobacteria bacterium]|nr:retroviral-like aspartic protease family protein [Gammaproteobacteria bacterium]
MRFAWLFIVFTLGLVSGWQAHQWWDSPLMRNVSKPAPTIAQHQSERTALHENWLDKANYDEFLRVYELAKFSQNKQQQQNLHQQLLAFLSKPQPALSLWDFFMDYFVVEPEDWLAYEKYAALLSRESQLHAIKLLMLGQHKILDKHNKKIAAEYLQESIERYEAGLSTNQQLPELIELYNFLAEAEPSNYAYQLKLAGYLMQSGQTLEAEQVISLISPHSNEYGSAQTLLQKLNTSHGENSIAGQLQVPLRKIGEHYLVSLSLDDAHPLNLLIDTGASMSVVRDSDYYELSLAGEPGQLVTVQTANGQTQAQSYRHQQAAIGSASITPFDVLVLPLEPQDHYQGLLGMNFLKHFRFSIDQTQKQLLLVPRE